MYFSLRFRGPDRKACGFQHSPGGLGCFRDTFAVECLLAGVPLERVSVLLGHASVKVTERHYAPGSKSDSSSSKPVCAACGRTIMRVQIRHRRKTHDLIKNKSWKMAQRVGFEPGTANQNA